MSTRSDRASARAIDDLDRRLQALEELVAVGEGRLPTDTHSRAAATARNARARLGHGGAHTVVALAGSTGSGKSSLFNAIAAADLSSVGIRRPTTSAASAAVFGSEADALLDWLAVPRRHRLDGMRAATTPGGAGLDLSGLVLLDLPDHDSTVAAHRVEVDRLVQVVDVFVWVVDPQKYADAALHDDYLAHFAGHSDVSIVVLNHADVLDDNDRRRALDDLRQLLVADGMGDVRVMATSASTGDGVDQLVTELAAQASARRAFVSRLAADVDWVASDVATTIGAAPAAEVSRDARRRLELAFADAAGVAPVAEAVGKAHRVRGSAATGWPPTRWTVRLRPDPLRRLGLDRRSGAGRRRAGSARESAGDAAAVARTSRAAPDAVAMAKVDNALRVLVDDTSAGLPTAWRDGIADASTPSRADVTDALDRAVGAADLATERPRWWTAAGSLQWLLAAAMVVGLAWLVAMGVVAWFGLPDLPVAHIGALPLPTVLALGGALAGLLCAAASRWINAAGARRRSAAIKRQLTRAVGVVAEELVVRKVDAELVALRQLVDLARRLA